MAQIITEDTTQQLLKGITIPPQPQLMVDLHMEMAMPEPCFADIAKIITKDVGISGSILKVINSPFFQLRNQVTSIGQALNLLGLTNIFNIVNSLSIRNSLSDNTITALTQFWDNAQDVAMAAAAISKLTGVASPDEAYSLGLFHNRGCKPEPQKILSRGLSQILNARSRPIPVNRIRGIISIRNGGCPKADTRNGDLIDS